MSIKFLLLVNKQGQTRLSQYYEELSIQQRAMLESEIVRKCLGRHETQCSFLDYQNYQCIYRRYASLFFIVGISSSNTMMNHDTANMSKKNTAAGDMQTHYPTENQLSILELIHNLVETLDRYFENVCELDIMFNLEKTHFIIDEMLMNGCIVETNKKQILRPIKLLDSIRADE